MKNLTRWNRSSLTQFRYIDGNAETFFNDMMADFSRKFIIGSNSNDHLLKETSFNYQSTTSDWGIEILRAFARSTQVLTEHINDYANEMTLSTARQRSSLVKLSTMIDYKQSPPASATVLLSLNVKQNQHGELASGFQCKNNPGTSESIFETTSSLWVSSQLNAFRPANYNRSNEPIKGNKVILNRQEKSLSVGEPILFKNDNTQNVEVRLIEALYEEKGNTVVRFTPRLSEKEGFVKGSTTIKFKPKVSQSLVGPKSEYSELSDSLYLKEIPVGLYKGDIVCISDNKRTVFATVRNISGKRVLFKQNQKIGRFNVNCTYLSQAKQLPVASVHKRKSKITTLKVPGDHSYLINTDIADINWVKGKQQYSIQHGAKVVGMTYHTMTLEKDLTEDKIKALGYSFINVSHGALKQHLQNPQVILTRPATQGWKVDAFIEVKKQDMPQMLELDEASLFGTNSDVLLCRGKHYCWGRLTTVNKQGATTKLSIDRWNNRGGDLFFINESQLKGDFQLHSRCYGWDVNTETLALENITLDMPRLPEELTLGRKVIIESEGNNYPAEVCTLYSPNKISLMPLGPVPHFKRGTTLFKANCILANHGKTLPAKYFSVGESAQSDFTVELNESRLTFVSNSVFSSGVSAAIQVFIAQEKWSQVEDFFNSAAHDKHYIIEPLNESYVARFGDGYKGKKAPAGYNNIKIVYRKGTGLKGNLAEGSIEKLVAPNALIESVSQPFSAFGGNDIESEASIKQSASCRISAMQRAVSVDDFGKLLTSNSSVWEAKAIANISGTSRRRKIPLVVVPAGGGMVTPSLKKQLTHYLQQHAQPGIDIEIVPYETVVIDIKVNLQVNSQKFNFETVESTVRTMLLATLALNNRRLGQALNCSQLYGLIEAQQGVENSIITINGQSNVTRWPASANQVIYLIDNGSNLTVKALEYTQ